MGYKTITILIVVAFLCGCVTPGSRDNAQEEPLVRLSSFKIVDNDGKVGIEMTETGQIIEETKMTGVIDSKGIVFDAHGKLIARLQDTGILENANGKQLVKISADGTMDDGSGVLIHWLKDGTLSRGDETLGLKLLPQDSPARRAASIILFLYFTPDVKVETQTPMMRRRK